MTANCNVRECSKTWGRDPVLEVECPTCGRDVGQRCQRPSGWSGPFVKPHKARDLKALEEGHYGECPLGTCPSTLGEIEGADQADLSSFG